MFVRMDLTKKFDGGFHGDRMEGDTFTHGFLVAFSGPAVIPATRDIVPIYQLEVCLREGTLAGDYPIVLTAGEFADAGSGRAIKPALENGMLTVAAGVTVTGDCD